MAETITANLEAQTRVLHQNTAPLNQTYNGTVIEDYTSSPSATKFYFNNYSVPTSGITLTLNNGSLVDAYGNALTFSGVSHLHIVNHDANKSVTPGGGSNPLLVSGMPAITAGGCLFLTATQSVTSGACNLKLVSSSGTVSTDVLILGN